jgi:hypothetical protein
MTELKQQLQDEYDSSIIDFKEDIKAIWNSIKDAWDSYKCIRISKRALKRGH